MSTSRSSSRPARRTRLGGGHGAPNHPFIEEILAEQADSYRDVVFLDGSHRVFMNNDASVFFLDGLPRLPPGVLVGVHDIFLPEDYGPDAARL